MEQSILSWCGKMDCFASLAMTVVAVVAAISVIVPGRADRARDVVVAGGKLHAGAGRLLADGRAVDFLPRRPPVHRSTRPLTVTQSSGGCWTAGRVQQQQSHLPS